MELGLQNISERRDFFLSKLVFQSIHCLVPNYLCDRIVMRVDIRGFIAGCNRNMDVYLPFVRKDIFKNSFIYAGGVLWNALPSVIKHVTDLDDFKCIYRQLILPHLNTP